MGGISAKLRAEYRQKNAIEVGGKCAKTMSAIPPKKGGKMTESDQLSEAKKSANAAGEGYL